MMMMNDEFMSYAILIAGQYDLESCKQYKKMYYSGFLGNIASNNTKCVQYNFVLLGQE